MILPVEQLVTSRELSERRVNLGAPTETYFEWAKKGKWWTLRKSFGNTVAEVKNVKTIPAYLSGEIGEMLKDEWVSYDFKRGNWRSHWYEKVGGIGAAVCQRGIQILEENEAESRGELWCDLKKQGLIK
jgi:hypothetical protein